MTWYVIDGMDGSGKSTASDYLTDRLLSSGRRVYATNHPNRSTKYGKVAAEYLLKHGTGNRLMATLFYILDVIQSLKYKRRHESEYDDFVFVRYSLAVAYLPEKLCKLAYKVIEMVLPIPEVKIYVDIEPQVAMDRIIERGEELEVFETIESLNKTRHRMSLVTESWNTVDNSGTIENTHRQVEDVLGRYLG